MVLQLELVEYLKEQVVAVPLADAPNAARPYFEIVAQIPVPAEHPAAFSIAVPAASDVPPLAVVPSSLAEPGQEETSQCPEHKHLLG